LFAWEDVDPGAWFNAQFLANYERNATPVQFVKGARYDMMRTAFGGVGVNATTPQELKVAMTEAIASGKPTLINAVIDETAGTESGRITSLNPQTKKN
jgi:oxalyl-CoA decarboxylase